MQALGLVWGNIDSVTADLAEIRTRIEDPAQFGARLLLDHWRERKARGGFVVGRDVPSRKLAPVLRNLALYEPIEDGADFRIRLAGTAFMRRFGRDVTGLKLSDIYDRENFGSQRGNLAEIMETKAAFAWDVTVARDGREFLRFEALRLPVLSPNREDNWVMGGLFYSDWT